MPPAELTSSIDEISLDRFWDGIVDGKTVSEAYLPSGTSQLVAQLHAATPMTSTDPAFVARLERILMDKAAEIETTTARKWPLPAVRVPRVRWTWLAVPTTVAAVLVLFLFSMERADWRRTSELPVAEIPAPVVEFGVDRAVVASLAIPLEAIPDGETMVMFSRHLIAAGTVWTLPLAAPSQGVIATFLVNGQSTVQIDSEVRVTRANGSEEVIPAGTPFTLAAGDQKVALEGGAEATERYGIATDARSYSLRISDNVAPADSMAYGDVVVPDGVVCRTLGDLTADDWSASGLEGHALTATLSIVTLAPGGEIVINASDPISFRYVDSGALRWDRLNSEGTPVNSRPLYFANGRAIPWTQLTDGDRIVLLNDGEEPVDMIELTLQPA